MHIPLDDSEFMRLIRQLRHLVERHQVVGILAKRGARRAMLALEVAGIAVDQFEHAQVGSDTSAVLFDTAVKAVHFCHGLRLFHQAHLRSP